MGFDTDRHRVRKVWEEEQGTKNSLDSITLLQGKKQSQVLLSSPRVVQFGKFQVLNSEWLPLVPKGVQDNGDYDSRGINFIVETTIPPAWIPYARMNVAYRRTDGINVFDSGTLDLITFMQIFESNLENVKKIHWNLGFVQTKGSLTPPWYDYEMKLFFTMINPSYITVS